MPVKKVKSQKSSVGRSRDGRLARFERPTHETGLKDSKLPRSLSERRQRNTEVKPKKMASRRSVVSQSGKLPSMLTSVYDLKGKVVGKMSLSKEIFGAKINKSLMAQAVRVYLANQRRGTASTKTRGEVTGSTRKIYRQKGTGRARHGSVRAPIFVHGGVVFGPKPRDYSLNFPKKMRKAALFSALSAKLKAGEIKILKGLEKIEPKTKIMVKTLDSLSVATKKRRALLVTPKNTSGVWRATRNIAGVELTLVNQLNTYQVLRSGVLLFMSESIEAMQKSLKGE